MFFFESYQILLQLLYDIFCSVDFGFQLLCFFICSYASQLLFQIFFLNFGLMVMFIQLFKSFFLLNSERCLTKYTLFTDIMVEFIFLYFLHLGDFKSQCVLISWFDYFGGCTSYEEFHTVVQSLKPHLINLKFLDILLDHFETFAIFDMNQVLVALSID